MIGAPMRELMINDFLIDIFQLHITLRFVRQRRLTVDFI